MSMIGLGALAGGFSSGWDKQEKVKMEKARAERENALLDLQIADQKRRDEEARRNAADEEEARVAAQKYFMDRNPQLDKSAPAAPYADDEGNQLSPDQISPEGAAALARKNAPARDPWAVKKDMIDANQAGMDVLLKNGNSKLYQEAAKRHAEMRHMYRTDLANHIYDAVTRGDMENAHSKLAEMYGMIDDGGTVKQHGSTTGADGKQRFYADVEKDGKVTRHEYTADEFRHMAGRFASPDMMAYDTAAANAAFEKAYKLRDIGLKERNTAAGEKRAEAESKKADAAATQAEHAGTRAEAAMIRAERGPAGRGTAANGTAATREADRLVEEGIFDNFDDAYRHVTRGKDTKAAADRARGIRALMALKDNLGRPRYKTEKEATDAYDRSVKTNGGIRRTTDAEEPVVPRDYSGFSAVPVR